MSSLPTSSTHSQGANNDRALLVSPLAARLVAVMALLATMVATLAVDTTTSIEPVGAIEQPPVDIDNLNMVPERMWGVSGQDPLQTQTPSIDVLVWDFAQIGNRMFVGGAFFNVQENKDATPIPQPYVAAFDLNSGTWIQSWTPQLDRVVYSLEVFDGALLVGGEFERVNGEARAGLVALDPITGEIDRSFAGSMDRPWSDNRAMVRDMEVDGSSLYVVGNFSHANGVNGQRVRVFNAARFTSVEGAVDTEWRPEVTGSSIWGVATDPSRGEVHFTGFFTAVNGDANSGHFHTVDDVTGASAPGKIDIPRNFPPAQPEMFDVAMGNDVVFVSGEQHIMQVFAADDHEMVAFANTGQQENGFDYTGAFAGGAYQVAERIGDIVFAGCHCTYSERNGFINHYSSVTGRRTPHRLVMAYDANTGALLENFMADIHSPMDGTWAVAADTNGCLYLGGDFHVGGVDSGVPRWLGGFGKLCPKGFEPAAQPEVNANALVQAGSTWRYDDSGTDLGTPWREPGYDDGAWAEGPAEFGFGEKNLATEWTPGSVTYYARTTFQNDGGGTPSLELKLRADDGAVVYLNGTEILRDNLPAGTITHDTATLDWKGGADENFVSHIVSADALVPGTNTLAVEVHNVWRNNNDLRFDLELAPSDQTPPEPAPEPGADDLVPLGSTWNYTSSANGEPDGWELGLAGAAQGPAEFGFGDKDEATELPGGEEAWYFTHEFSVKNLRPFAKGLEMDLVVDDGAVVYLNGTEVHRFNMPAGAVEFNTRPTRWVNGKDEGLRTLAISSEALVEGTNVVAVEVHNYWPGNNDLSFDLALR